MQQATATIVFVCHSCHWYCCCLLTVSFISCYHCGFGSVVE